MVSDTMPFSEILNLEKKVDGNLSWKCWNWRRWHVGEKPPMFMGPSHWERPPTSQTPTIPQNSPTGPEKGETVAYLKSHNAIEFRLLFNIDANTAVNARKYDTWFYLIKSYSILGFWVYCSTYI